MKSQPSGRLFILGTSAAVPTVNRSHPSVALWWRGETILFDCGEGSQRQMMKAGLSLDRVTSIFITHMHGDHVLGLPGLLMTMTLQNRRRPLKIFGPRGLRQFIESCLPMIFYRPLFQLDVLEVNQNSLVASGKRYKVYSYRVRHSVESYAYCFKEDDRPGKFEVKKAEMLEIGPGPLRRMLVEGKPVEVGDRLVRPEEVVGPPRPGVKIVYTGDTGPTEGFEEFCRNADILIHESTFDESMSGEAENLQHSTCIDAAKLASKAGVKKLILMHISSRYSDPSVLLEQARRFFSDVQVAEDFTIIDIY
ncbi:MAG: ribonuclease Z [Thermoproteota archaeon]